VDQALIQDCSLGHVSNSDDNSYGLGLWFSNGSIVRRNVVFDSAYWGGTANSKGITLMVSGRTAPNWLCDNEVFHIPGNAAIGTKGGVSNLRVIGNRIHDSHVGVELSHVRDQDGMTYPAGQWVISQNVIERCQLGVFLTRYGHQDRAQPGDSIVNNLFRDNRGGVVFAFDMPPDERVHNNIFVGGAMAATCTSEVCDTGMYFGNNAGEVRDFDYLFAAPISLRVSHNLYFGFRFTHGVNRNWTANYVNRDLAMFQSAFSGVSAERGSLVADPMLDIDNRPRPGSPALGAGLGGQNIGIVP
jgi:hypothetical protein